MDSSSIQSHNSVPSRRFAIDLKKSSEVIDLVRAYSIDLFAVLLPGFLFVVSMAVSLGLPVLALLVVLDKLFSDNFHVGGFIESNGGRFVQTPNPPDFGAMYSILINGASAFSIYLFIAVLSFSYVAGSLLFRQDPKVPDRYSYIRIHKDKLFADLPVHLMLFRKTMWFLRSILKRQPGRIQLHWPVEKPTDEVVEQWKKRCEIYGRDEKIFEGVARPQDNAPFLDQVDVQFPYANLAEYLKERGFDELAKRVAWNQPGGTGVARYRSKYFINTLKINIEYMASDHFGRILRNEQEIRLSTSSWYAVKFIRRYALVGLIFQSVACMLSYQYWNFPFLLLIIPPALVVLYSYLLTKGIERSLHYQRGREVFYVLQLASLLALEKPEVYLGLPTLPASIAQEGNSTP